MARVKSFMYPVAFGVYTNDANSCALRAYSYVTDTAFERTQDLFRLEGREFGQPTAQTISHKLMLEAGLECMGVFGKGRVKENFAYWCRQDKPIDERYDEDQKGVTLKTFCETYNNGKYAVYIKGHITVVHDGKIVDSFAQRGNAAVITAYRKPE